MDITYNVNKKRFDALLDRADFWNEYNVVKEIGFWFDKEVQPPVWWTTDIGKLRCLWAVKKFPAGLRISPEDKARAKELGKAFDAAVVASHALDSDIDIPVPPGNNPATGKPFAYLPYQRGGIAYALRIFGDIE